MADRKQSHVQNYFSFTNSQDVVCDTRGKTTNLVKHIEKEIVAQNLMMSIWWC